MEKFKSKIDLSIVLFLALVLSGILVNLLLNRAWIVSLVILLQIAFIAHLYSNTFYTINDQKLIVKSGFLVNVSLDILSIKKISETNSIMSAPSLSFDRLEISYNTQDTIVISPKDKSRFIDAIEKINSQVEIKLKENTPN